LRESAHPAPCDPADRVRSPVSTLILMVWLRSKRSTPSRRITHRFALDRIDEAFENFAVAAKTKAVAVIIDA
jgi:threonine dehydrogenase-like Zn-dependent dehydrogenase